MAVQPSGWSRAENATNAAVQHAAGIEDSADSVALVTYLPKVEEEPAPTVRPAPRRNRDSTVTRLPSVAAQTPTVRPARRRSPERSVVHLPQVAASKTGSAEKRSLEAASPTTTGAIAQRPTKKASIAALSGERRTLIDRRRAEPQEAERTQADDNLPQPRTAAANLPMVAKSEPRTHAPVPSPLRSTNTNVVRVDTKHHQPSPQSSLAASVSDNHKRSDVSPSQESRISPAAIAENSPQSDRPVDRSDEVAAAPTTPPPAHKSKDAAPMDEQPSPESSLAESKLDAAPLATDEKKVDSTDRRSQAQVAKLQPLPTIKPLPNPDLVSLPQVAEARNRERSPRELDSSPSVRESRERSGRRPTLFDRALASHGLEAAPPVVTPKYIPYASPNVAAPRPMKLVPIERAYMPPVGAPQLAGAPTYLVQPPHPYVVPAAAPPVQYLFAQTTTQPNQADPPPAPPGGDTEYGEAPPSTAQLFLRRQSVLLEPGEWQFDIGLAYQIYENDVPLPIVDANGRVVAVADGRTRLRLLSVPLRARFGFSPNLQLYAGTLLGWSNSEISFVGNDQYENIGGIGDINLGGNFRLCEGDFYRPEVIGTLGFTIPSGNAAFDLFTANPQALLGQGFWSLNASVLFVNSFDPITVFYGAGYIQRFEREFNGLNVTPGAIATYQFGVGFAVNSRVTLSTAFQGFYAEEFEVNSERLPGTILEPQGMRFAATIAKNGTILEPFAVIGMTDDAVSSSIGMIKTY